MREVLTMRNGELDRLRVIQKVLEERLRWREAGRQLGLSVRQVGRLCAQVRSEGNGGVIHGLRGKASNHQIDAGIVERALELVKECYADFGPTFANEKLRERHAVVLSTSVLRKGMIREGLWRVRRHRIKHRAWRQRRDCVGELIQLDGSEHDWFEGRGPVCVFLLYIDDATSRLMWGEFIEVEATRTLFGCTKTYIERYGRPLAWYVDKDSIYRINRQATIEEQLREEQPLTQFTRAMKELGIEVIAANSPQAKGRVERSFDTHQDRLVKELRLAGISRISDANRFVQEKYLSSHNERFAVEPANRIDAHRPVLKGHDLDATLSVRTPRVLAKDFTLRCQSRYYQVLANQMVRPGQVIDVERRLDGSTHLRYQGRYLSFRPITKLPVHQPVMVRTPAAGCRVARTIDRPARRHPWKGPSYLSMLRRKGVTDGSGVQKALQDAL